MEEVLGVYTRPLDPRRPLVCFDETSKQHTAEVRAPLPASPHHPLRYDTEYERNGVSNLFMCFAPLLHWRQVTVTDRRTAIDWAHCMRDLVDAHFPAAERVVVVQDNLNTHTVASLYEAFPPAEARRIADRLEIHYTPKHGSWLNMAEIELGILARQCLDRRIPDQPTLRQEATAWMAERNAADVTVNWRFTTDDARIKLAHLYPVLEPLK